MVKLNSNGTPDTNFGTNGTLTIGQTFFGSESVLLGNILYVTRTSSLDTIDISTGGFTSITINGLSEITNVFAGPNGNLLLESINTTTFTNNLTLVNTSGAKILTFGVNGTTTVNTAPTSTDFSNSYGYVAMDSSSNIYYGMTNESNYTTTIKKIDSNGNIITTFGTNGSYLFTNNVLTDLKVLSNQVYLSGINVIGSDLNLFLARLNSDGTLDNNFDNDGIYIFDSNSLNEWAESLNVISPTTVIVAGEYLGTNNTIFVGKFVVTPNLSTSEVSLKNAVWFENPVKSNLNYKSSEKVLKISIYSVEGKLVKLVTENKTDVSLLPKGIYVAKIEFQSGKTITKKLLKN